MGGPPHPVIEFRRETLDCSISSFVLNPALVAALMQLERSYDGLLVRFKISRKRSEEHTSELQSLMRISYAVFCLKTKTTHELSLIHHYELTPHIKSSHPNQDSSTQT